MKTTRRSTTKTTTGTASSATASSSLTVTTPYVSGTFYGTPFQISVIVIGSALIVVVAMMAVEACRIRYTGKFGNVRLVQMTEAQYASFQRRYPVPTINVIEAGVSDPSPAVELLSMSNLRVNS